MWNEKNKWKWAAELAIKQRKSDNPAVFFSFWLSNWNWNTWGVLSSPWNPAVLCLRCLSIKTQIKRRRPAAAAAIVLEKSGTMGWPRGSRYFLFRQLMSLSVPTIQQNTTEFFWLVLIRNYYDSLWRVFMDVVLWFCGYHSGFSLLQMEIMDFSNQAFYWWPNLKGKHTFPYRIYCCWFKDFSIKMSKNYLFFWLYFVDLHTYIISNVSKNV